jgi:hypothetical protein
LNVRVLLLGLLFNDQHFVSLYYFDWRNILKMSALVPDRILRRSHIKKVLRITRLLSTSKFVKKLNTLSVCINWVANSTKIFSRPGSSFVFSGCLFFYVLRILDDMIYIRLDRLFYGLLIFHRLAKVVLSRSKDSSSSNPWRVSTLFNRRV